MTTKSILVSVLFSEFKINFHLERLQKPDNFNVTRKNISAVEFTWSNVITPYSGEYLLECELEQNPQLINFSARLNTTSYTWDIINSRFVYFCQISVCWNSTFNGVERQYCPPETISTLRFRKPNRGMWLSKFDILYFFH